MAEFLQNRATLTAKLAQLESKSSMTPEEVALFQQQNGDLLKRQAQLAQAMAQQEEKIAVPMPAPLQVPPEASPQIRAFMTARDQLAREEIAFRNQHLNDDPSTQETALQQWHQQNAARFQEVQQLALSVSKQMSPTSLPLPPPLQFPPNASPELRAFLTARDQLVRDEIAFQNQHATDDEPTRTDAHEQWQKQNAARFQQLQQLAQALPKTN